MTEDISNERIEDILHNTRKDWRNLMTFYDSVEYFVQEDVSQIPQCHRQRLVEAYNKYRSAPYDWYEREETAGDI